MSRTCGQWEYKMGGQNGHDVDVALSVRRSKISIFFRSFRCARGIVKETCIFFFGLNFLFFFLILCLTSVYRIKMITFYIMICSRRPRFVWPATAEEWIWWRSCANIMLPIILCVCTEILFVKITLFVKKI